MNSNVPQQDRAIDLQIVEGPAGISQFADAWDDLFDRAVDAPPYLSRWWAGTFVEEARLQGSPLFILAWSNKRLVALLPLAIRKSLSVKIATPIGTGQPTYLGLLLDPAYRSVIANLADLIASKRLFDVYCSGDLSSQDAATDRLLGQLQKRGYSCRKVLRRPCLWAKLGCPFDEYLERNIPRSKRRSKLRYKEKRLYKSAGVQVRRYVGRQITPELNRRVADIQLESWIHKRGGAVLWQPFFQKLMANMAEGGFGRLWLMTIDGEDAAFAYSFVAHGHNHYFWPAFKLKYESQLSIGQMLLMRVIRDCCADGIESLDFMHGDAAYKRFWATDSHNVYRVVASRGLRGRLIAGAYYLTWSLGRSERLRSAYRRIRARTRRIKQTTT